MQFKRVTQGKTCTRSIVATAELECEELILKDVEFTGGGCQGNLLAVKKLILNKPIKQIIEMFKNIPCGNKGTSCANELALLLEEIEPEMFRDAKDCFFYTGVDIRLNEHECTFYNGVCEHHTDCPYRTNIEKYKEIVNRINKNTNNVSIIL